MVRNQEEKIVKNCWSRAFTITAPRKETELLPCISISHPYISLPTQVNSLTTQCRPLYLLSYFRLFLTFSLFESDLSLPGATSLLINFFCDGLFSDELFLGEPFGFVVPTLSFSCSPFSPPVFAFATLSADYCDDVTSFESLEFSEFVSGSRARRLSRSCPRFEEAVTNQDMQV